jgi:2-isopropylmalate synthase
MNVEEKLRVADVLEGMGVDVIEAGFPIASEGDFQAVQAIAKRVRESVVCGLARAQPATSTAPPRRSRPPSAPRIHTFIGTSPLHRKYQLGLDAEQVHERVVREREPCQALHRRRRVERHGRLAHRAGLPVPLHRERDQRRRHHDQHPRHGGLRLPRGVRGPDPRDQEQRPEHRPGGHLGPLPQRPRPRGGELLARGRGGRAQIECTINGIGERAGNCSLEEVVMAMHVRADRLPYRTGVVTQEIMKASRLVSAITGFQVQPNKAIVGANAFAHESGIHQDGMLKNAQTYEIMRPEDIGLFRSSLVMGKHSGRHAFKKKLEELGYALGENALNDAFVRFKTLADKKKEVFDEDLWRWSTTGSRPPSSGSASSACASSAAARCARGPPGARGRRRGREAVSGGDGPVDATFRAVREIVPHTAELQLFQIGAVTQGTDAQAEVTVRLAEDGKTVNGIAADTDTIVAAARAYVAALNKLLTKRERDGPRGALGREWRQGPVALPDVASWLPGRRE